MGPQKALIQMEGEDVSSKLARLGSSTTARRVSLVITLVEYPLVSRTKLFLGYEGNNPPPQSTQRYSTSRRSTGTYDPTRIWARRRKQPRFTPPGIYSRWRKIAT